MNKETGFTYTYSAKEQAEIKSIRDKYVPKEKTENKIDKLRALDTRASRRAQTVALVFGIIGTLILGFGMSMFMTTLGAAMGLGATAAMAVGIVLGIIGGTLAGIAYPLYSVVLKHEREKNAPEILRLCDELLK